MYVRDIRAFAQQVGVKLRSIDQRLLETGTKNPRLVTALFWAGYFRFGYPRDAFDQINRHVLLRLGQHLRRRSQPPFQPPEGVSLYEHYKRLGLRYL